MKFFLMLFGLLVFSLSLFGTPPSGGPTLRINFPNGKIKEYKRIFSKGKVFKVNLPREDFSFFVKDIRLPLYYGAHELVYQKDDRKISTVLQCVLPTGEGGEHLTLTVNSKEGKYQFTVGCQ